MCIFVPEVYSNLSIQAAWAGLILVFLMLCCCCLPWLAGTQIRVHLWDKHARCGNLEIFIVILTLITALFIAPYLIFYTRSSLCTLNLNI